MLVIEPRKYVRVVVRCNHNLDMIFAQFANTAFHVSIHCYRPMTQPL